MLDRIIQDKKEEVKILKSNQKHTIADVLDMEFEKREFYSSLRT